MYPSTPVERTCGDLNAERPGDASLDTVSLSSAAAAATAAAVATTAASAVAAAPTTAAGSAPQSLRAPTPSLVFTTQFASTPYLNDTLASSSFGAGGSGSMAGAGASGTSTHPLHVTNYNAVVMSSSVVSNNGRRQSVSQLQFEDSPIKVTCRTRGRSHSPYLAPVQAAEAQQLQQLQQQQQQQQQQQHEFDASSHAMPYGFSYSGRTSPVQAMAPNFDLMPLSPSLAHHSLAAHAYSGAGGGGGGDGSSSGAVTPTSHTPVHTPVHTGGAFGDEAHAYYATHAYNNNNNASGNPYGQQYSNTDAALMATTTTAAGGVDGGGGACYGDVVGYAPQTTLQEQTLPASVVHRALHGRCRFVAFPSNLPNIRCRNSRDTAVDAAAAAACATNTTATAASATATMAGGGDAVMGGSSSGSSSSNNNNNTVMDVASGGGGGGNHSSSSSVDGSTRAAAAATATSTPSPMSSNSDKHALFIGQVRFETTPAELLWLVQRTTGACASHLESRGAGCYLLFCNSAADMQLVRTLHKRILFDMGGVWFARTAEEVDALCEYVALDAALLSRKSHLPRDSMVVEELKDGATSSRRVHGHPRHTHHTQQQQQQQQQQQPYHSPTYNSNTSQQLSYSSYFRTHSSHTSSSGGGNGGVVAADGGVKSNNSGDGMMGASAPASHVYDGYYEHYSAGQLQQQQQQQPAPPPPYYYNT